MGEPNLYPEGVRGVAEDQVLAVGANHEAKADQEQRHRGGPAHTRRGVATVRCCCKIFKIGYVACAISFQALSESSSNLPPNTSKSVARS